jgi:DNA-binding NtrC family response regulator
VVKDPTVSWHHFTIRAQVDGFLLEDRGSRNGTTLGGFRIRSAYVGHGATIGAGETQLRFIDLHEEVKEPISVEERYGRALGRSPAMRRIFALLPRIAAADATVLIDGETGTGKSILADAIHTGSSRARGPFVTIDCSAIPPTLIESELFGHERGAFTGAQQARAGAFEAAAGGTLFLDEVGDLPLDMQPKLLRALEDRVVKRIGSNREVKLDVRIIAATNRDLRDLVNRGAFRSDLFFRLNTVRLSMPPLRERPEDIRLLADYFHEQLSEAGGPAPDDLVAALERGSWPGNVRELRSAIERAVILGVPADEPSVTASAGDKSASYVFTENMTFRGGKERVVADWERWFVRELLRRHDGNLSRAARAARMDRAHLRELLRRHAVAVRDDS